MQENNNFSKNNSIKNVFMSLIPLLPLNLNIAIYVQYKKNMTDR